MKRKMVAIVCALAVGLGTTGLARASDGPDPEMVATDALIVRPLCLVGTVIGSAIFVVSLPVAATSGSIKTTKEALVLKPARATFKRPLGDMDALQNP